MGNIEKVSVNASRNYDVLIGSGLLDNAGKYISEVISCKKTFIVSDDTVFGLYGDRLRRSVTDAGFETASAVFRHGEQSKTLETYSSVLNAMGRAQLSRGDAVVALGGGVVGDLAGFAASTYQRGIAFVQIPTTLLAAVDSSVGGKTAVDLPSGKNQVGSFWQPSLVLCDTDTLDTLPDAEYRNGCAEIIKYAMIGSGELFRDIAAKPVKEQYESVITRCVAMKRDFVEQDERDTGCRMMLNFGHTAGHAVETCSGYAIPHGEAVAIGMAIITRAVCALGICDKSVGDELIRLIAGYGLPTETEFKLADMSAAALNDKKRSGDRMTIVVPESVGKCVLREIAKDEFSEWLKAGGIE